MLGAPIGRMPPDTPFIPTWGAAGMSWFKADLVPRDLVEGKEIGVASDLSGGKKERHIVVDTTFW